MVSFSFLEKKRVRLGLLGFFVFLILVGVFYFYFMSSPIDIVDDTDYVSFSPYFVSQFRDAFPDDLKEIVGDDPVEFNVDDFLEPGPEREEVFLSEGGFSEEKVVFGDSGIVRVLNVGESSNLVVTSPDLDGEPFIVSRVNSFDSGDEVVLIFLKPEYLFEVVDKGYASIEKAEDGLLVFEVSCIQNCDPENNFFQVFFARPE